MMKTKTEIIKILKNSGIGIMRTDTIYGLVGSAFSQKAVERIYQVKQRNSDKPLIILISSFEDLKGLGVKISEDTRLILEKVWPGKISVVLPFFNEKIKYLNKKWKTLAIRFPDDKSLIEILKEAGSLVATSANLENKKPAENISEAKKYFGNKVDFYLDDGELISSHSTLVEIKNGEIKILRKGGVDISDINDKIKNIQN